MTESNAPVKRNHYETENKLLLQEKGIYDKIVAERKNEINTFNNKTECDTLKYHFKSKNRTPISFIVLIVH